MTFQFVRGKNCAHVPASVSGFLRVATPQSHSADLPSVTISDSGQMMV